MTTEVIARTGGEYTYVELKMERVGAAIVLVAELVLGSRYSSREDRDELHSEVFLEEDPEDTENLAIDAATDIERIADARLEDLGVFGWKDRDFGAAVEAFLEMRRADAPPVAAE